MQLVLQIFAQLQGNGVKAPMRVRGVDDCITAQQRRHDVQRLAHAAVEVEPQQPRRRYQRLLSEASDSALCALCVAVADTEGAHDDATSVFAVDGATVIHQLGLEGVEVAFPGDDVAEVCGLRDERGTDDGVAVVVGDDVAHASPPSLPSAR